MIDARGAVPSTSPRAGIDKKALRAQCIAAREAVPLARRAAWDAAITERLVPLLMAQSGRCVGLPIDAGRRYCVGLYFPWKAEYDPRALAAHLRRRGVETALPVVIAPNEPLLFAAWDEATALVADRFGIPTPAAPRFIEPDLLVVPLNAFDARNFRLGYGGGFYDRTLAALHPRPRTIGVAYQIARVDDLAPRDHDIAMDLVVTEQGIARAVAA